MKILLTGGTGFIGSRLLQKLEELGHDVYTLVRYVSGGRYNFYERQRKVFADIRDGEAVRKAVIDVKPEIVIHLAAQTAVSFSFLSPADVLHTNAVGTIHLAEAAREVGVKQFIHASTSEYYGVQTKYPIKEDAVPNATSPYAVSKIAAENYLWLMYNIHRFPITIMRPFNCYDNETEILTNEGWKRFADLNHHELVATLNPLTDTLEFQKPTEYISTKYEGKMIHVSGSQLDLLVTPNHRMWIRRRRGRTYEIKEAKELLKWNGKRYIHFQLSCDWQPEVNEDSRWYNPNWIKFLAWWLSEGSLDRRHNHETIDIRQCNRENLEEIYQTCLTLGLKAHKYWYDDCGRVRIYGDTELYKYLKDFGHSQEKFIPEEIKRLPRHLIRLFINTYQKGDGSRGSYNGYEVRDCIISQSRRMLDDLQELVLKAGWSCSIKGRFLTIARTRTEVCPRTSKNFTIQKYKGKIYCVSVPNGLLYVRRHGKAVFCGNSFGRANVKNRHYVVERAITGALEKNFINLHNPKPVREFIFRDDHVKGYLCALGNKKAIGEAFNICYGKGYTIKEMADKVAEIVNRKFNRKVETSFIRSPDRPMDIPKLVGDPSKAKEKLGWKPDYTFETGLEKAIDEWAWILGVKYGYGYPQP